MKKDKFINKIVFYIFVLCEYKIPKERIEQIANDEIRCLTEKELIAKRLINSLNYVFNNMNQTFNEEILNQSYYLLTHTLIDKEIVNKIVKMYYENYDNSAYYLTSLIHLFIIQNIKDKHIEFAFIISELIMLKKNKTLLIPREYSHQKYKQAILNNDFSLLLRVFFDIEYVTDNNHPCKYTKDEIIQKIKEIKNDFISKFDIRKLYLFGSFVKETNNEQSDVDFLVILSEKLINIERLEQIDRIKGYLSGVLECSVDVLDFTFALNNLGENEMEHTIALI